MDNTLTYNNEHAFFILDIILYFKYYTFLNKYLPLTEKRLRNYKIINFFYFSILTRLIINMDPIIETIMSVVTLYSFIFNDEDSDDDEDTELLELQIHELRRRLETEKNKPNRVEMFVERTIANSTALEFQSHFRMSMEAFEWLYRTVAPELQSARISGRQMIDPKTQILAVLWLLATPDSYRYLISNQYSNILIKLKNK